MNFGQALEAAKSGAKIYRDGWNGKGQFVIAIPGTSNVLPREGTPYADLDISPLGVVDIAPHLDLKNAQGHMQPGWVPSMGDLFANDWGATPHEPTSGLLPHQQRVTDELQELQQRLDKLTGFIAGDAFSTLPEQDQRLLEAQSHIMSAYVEVLTQRIKRF